MTKIIKFGTKEIILVLVSLVIGFILGTLKTKGDVKVLKNSPVQAAQYELIQIQIENEKKRGKEMDWILQNLQAHSGEESYPSTMENEYSK